jgi:uncharacterized protein (DUF362 family)
MKTFDRRNFLKTSLLTGAAVTCCNPVKALVPFSKPAGNSSRVAITSGKDRADMAFRALKPFSEEIKQAIGNKRVVIKPNVVLIYVPLACTHVDTLEGILEFLKSINKLQNVIIAESTASAPTLEGFDNYGYFRLLSKYPVKLVDLDREPFDLMYVINQNELRPTPIRVSRLILDPNSYIVSAARMKTHTSVVVTLSLKNIVFGAPLKDVGFTLYQEDIRFSDKALKTKAGTVNDKQLVHGKGNHGINYNMYSLSRHIYPDLALIDGYEGMEGNGPTRGTPRPHRVCVASTDWLAADRVGVELMGIDFNKIGYLKYCAKTGQGNADLNKIEIIGKNITDHIVNYKLPDNMDDLLRWQKPIH